RSMRWLKTSLHDCVVHLMVQPRALGSTRIGVVTESTSDGTQDARLFPALVPTLTLRDYGRSFERLMRTPKPSLGQSRSSSSKRCKGGKRGLAGTCRMPLQIF